MLSWFRGGLKPNIQVDIHSHLIPGIDDGCKSMDESIKVIKAMSILGFKKLVTTPHIYQEVYPNTAEDIINRLNTLKSDSRILEINIELEAAAEYYLDNHFLNRIKNNKKILSFGKERYVLFETGFQSKPIILEETIFELNANNYKPILAHPERYEYLNPKSPLVSKIRQLGLQFQVSLPSLKGYYGSKVKEKANQYIKTASVDFLATDIHRANQIEGLQKAMKIKLPKIKLLNDSLL